jgi:ABC-type branched-subunit amino acid transport system permease subunit
VAAALILPRVVGSRLPLYITGLAYVILFASLSLLVRMSGQVSLCHIAFAAVGASVSARAVGAGMPWLLALVLGGIIAAPVGAFVAIPAIRLSGVYLAIATFGFGLVVQRVFYTSILMFGGGFAIRAPRPHLPGLDTATDVGYYHVVLAVTMLCLVAIALLRRSRAGRILRAFADSPAAVDAHGLSTNELKVRVFAISAFFAGIAGGLIGPVTGTAAAGSGVVVGGFDFTVSLLLISVLFIAGRQPILSSIIAAALFVVVPGHAGTEFAQDYAPVIFGGLAVAAAVISGQPVLARLRASVRMEERARQDSRLTWRATVREVVPDVAGVPS